MFNNFWKWRNSYITNQDTGEVETERELFFNGTIASESWFDDEITPEIFRNELEAEDGPVTVWINSPGGDVIAAAQIYNMLMEHNGEITVKIDGIAASAASVIAMAGTDVYMSPVSMIMIHNPSTFTAGDAEEMKRAAAMLEEVKESIINAYEARTMLSRAKISKLMDSETWMNANTAIEYGFADGILYRNLAESKDNMDDLMIPKVEMFSETVIQNSLLAKLSAKQQRRMEQSKITTGNQQPQPTGRRVEDLINNLNLMKY